MVVGTEDSEELEEMLFRVPSKTLDLPDGDRVKVIGPIDLDGGHSIHLYQNNDTRALDKVFRMNGTPNLDYNQEGIEAYLGTCMLGENIRVLDEGIDGFIDNFKARYALAFFVRMAMEAGHFIGFQEDELRAQRKDLDHPLDVALTYTNGAPEPYLYRKEVEGHYVLFPRNLPKEFIALPEKAVA